MDFKCFLCAKEFGDIKTIFSHMKTIHALKDNKTQLFCVKNNHCKKSYLKFDSLRAHIKQCVKDSEQLEVMEK